MLFKNAVILNENFNWIKADLKVEDGKFTAVGHFDENGTDIGEKRIIPGFINIHMHGAMGYNVANADASAYDKIGNYLASTGTTSYLMAPATYLEADLKRYVALIGERRGKSEGANLLGANMEGPYLSASHKGAHRAEWLRTVKEVDFDSVNECGNGCIYVTTVAPETDGAIEFIRTHADKVKISLGHTGADYETCMKAFEAGATQVTHLFNAMPSLHHRNMSLISAALDFGAMAEIICDGLHVTPSVVRAAYKMFGSDKLIVINDSVMAAGMPDGVYSECGNEVIVKDGIAREHDGTIAGGTAPIIECVKNLISWGVPENEAVKMASANPAKAMGIENKGRIKTGFDADFLMVDRDFNVTDVYIGGKKFGGEKRA